MTVTDDDARTDTDPIPELRTWLDEAWDPDLTVGEWWERLGLSGWAAPILPAGLYGRGLGRGDATRVQREIASFGALPAPPGLGLLLAAPTITTHGTPEQVERYVRDIVTGQRAWCQLFSEPGAGSDLAGLTTRALRDGDEWIVNGQKVWTSGGHFADLGMLLARTDPDAPKHQGISWFAFTMDQPGVEVRPLKEMTGNALFSEVFFTDARVADADLVGGVNKGWGVANTTLMHERSGLGAGGGGRAPILARPGPKGGDLDKRVGDVVRRARPARSQPAAPAAAERRTSPAAAYIELARSRGKETDPAIRQGLARLHTLGELGRLNNERQKAARAAGRDVPGVANIAKLSMSDIVRLNRDLGLQILGPRGMLHGYDGDARRHLAEAIGDPSGAAITEAALSAQAPPIYGGTDQIQRNIIGERVLGLPKEPGDLAQVPFSQLPKNG